MELLQAYYYEKMGDNTLAEKEYRRLIRLDPHSGAVHNNYGAFLCRSRFYKEGIHQLLLAANNQHYINRKLAFHNAQHCQEKMAVAYENKIERKKHG